jgi:hypothetical protein
MSPPCTLTADLQVSRRRNKEQQTEIHALQNQSKIQQELIRELELEIIDLRADLKHANMQVNGLEQFCKAQSQDILSYKEQLREVCACLGVEI